MRQDGSAMDRQVMPRRLTPLRLTLGSLFLGATLSVVYLYPSLARWASAERSVDPERLRFGQVSPGDLLRDVWVQGRIIAADHPTLVSPAQGLVSLLVKAGDVVRKGHVMARIPLGHGRAERKNSQGTPDGGCHI